MTPQAVFDQLAQHEEEAIARLCEFLSIASISTDPAYNEHCDAAAEWIAERLRRLDLNVDIMPTSAHRAVVASTDEAGPDAPRVLFYGHYDVQPPDPLEMWTNPPFEPSIRAGRIYARGASDDKGQVMCFVEAIRAWRAAGEKLPVNLTLLIEGDEECSSDGLDEFIAQQRDRLAADVAVVSDTSLMEDGTPAITYGLRGMVYYDLQLHGPSRDLHSGVYGGTISNPATELALVLGQLLDTDRRIAIDGFYDDVAPVSEEERAMWARLNFDEKAYADNIGMDALNGEAGCTTLERRWARPACDVNGLYGGYMGAGAKTVIPTFAGAKVSFRLAANQDPARIDTLLRQWIAQRTPPGCRWQVTGHGQATPVVVPLDSPYLVAARRAMAKGFGQEPVMVREGATIPVVATFKRLLNMDTLLVGFGLQDDAIHSPNEKFELANFRRGCMTHAALLGELAK